MVIDRRPREARHLRSGCQRRDEARHPEADAAFVGFRCRGDEREGRQQRGDRPSRPRQTRRAIARASSGLSHCLGGISSNAVAQVSSSAMMKCPSFECDMARPQQPARYSVMSLGRAQGARTPLRKPVREFFQLWSLKLPGFPEFGIERNPSRRHSSAAPSPARPRRAAAGAAGRQRVAANDTRPQRLQFAPPAPPDARLARFRMAQGFPHRISGETPIAHDRRRDHNARASVGQRHAVRPVIAV